MNTRNLTVALVLLALSTAAAQQPNSPAASFTTFPCGVSTNGPEPPFLLSLYVPGSTCFKLEGAPLQPVILVAGTLRSGPRMPTAFGLADLDLSLPLVVIAPAGGLTTKPEGYVNLGFPDLPASLDGGQVAVQALVGDPTNPRAPFTLTTAFQVTLTLGQGRALDLGDDGAAAISLRTFAFPFYRTSWTSLYVNANGNLTFGAPDTGAVPTETAFLGGPPRIALFWSDLDPSHESGSSVIVGEQDGRLEVDWFAVPAPPSGSTVGGSMMLLESGLAWLAWPSGRVPSVDSLVGVTPGRFLSGDGHVDLTSGVQPSVLAPFQAVYERFGTANPFDLAGLGALFAPGGLTGIPLAGNDAGSRHYGVIDLPRSTTIAVTAEKESVKVGEQAVFTIKVTGSSGPYTVKGYVVTQMTGGPPTLDGKNEFTFVLKDGESAKKTVSAPKEPGSVLAVAWIEKAGTIDLGPPYDKKASKKVTVTD